MKRLLVFLFCFSSYLAGAQDIKIFVESTDRGRVIYAANKETWPVSISLQLELTNFNFSEGDVTVFVIPANTDRFKIGELTTIDKTSRTRYAYKYKSTWGDIFKVNLQKNYLYDLPYLKGSSFTVVQGYDGSFSHQDENALDFSLPEGTPVVAAREGIVVKVVQHNVEYCPKKECIQYNNYVLIAHSDGSFSKYIHLKYNGSKVKVGDTVKKEMVIALSGNTGMSAGPHLHFVCFVPGFEKSKAIETRFRIGDGSRAAFLKEKETYARQY